MVKKGFSLVETLVVMAVISVFFAAASKVITTRPKLKKQVNAHGYYECYLSGEHKQKYVRDGVETPIKSVSKCEFVPPSGIAFFNINTYNPCYSNFQPTINNTLTISLAGEDDISIKSSNDMSLDIQSNTECSDVEMYLKTLYSESEMYNNGTILKGVFISW